MKFFRMFFIVIPIVMVLVVGFSVSSYSIEKKLPKLPPIKTKTKSSSSLIPPAKSIKIKKKVTAYYCKKGDMAQKKLTLEEIEKSEIYSTDKSAVQMYCGVCCKNGKSSFVSSKREREKCNGKGIQFYTNAKDCKPARITLRKTYCCRDGVVNKMYPFQCKKAGGITYPTQSSGRQNCGWCCVNNKVVSKTRTECRKLGAKDYYQSKAVAEAECGEKPVIGKKTMIPQAGKGLKRPRNFPDHPDVKPLLLPDLDIIYTSTNSRCFMTGKVKNIGGPISAVNHAAATIHLSAGPGLISSKTKLSDIDPLAKLRLSGGEVTYTTNLRITQPNQATLVWVDTGHAIVESDEINNGDDALLTCKTPLVWCCVNGRVGRLTKDECESKKFGGTSYKTEKKANEECGRDDQLLQRPLGSSELVMRAKGPTIASFSFIHPSFGETFVSTTPLFTWNGHPEAEKYFVRIMRNDGSAPGSHRTIWERDGITTTNVVYNSDGSADEPLVRGQQYRANLYARYSSQTGIPDTDTADFIQMTGDVEFSISSLDGSGGFKKISAKKLKAPKEKLIVQKLPESIRERMPSPGAPCTGVDLVLNKIEVQDFGGVGGCCAKVWISQVCDGETTVETFYSMINQDGIPAGWPQPGGWTIPAGWSGPTTTPHESWGHCGIGCGTVTGTADYYGVEAEVNEDNNECSVTLEPGETKASRICHPF